MNEHAEPQPEPRRLAYRGGLVGSIAPFFLFVSGAAALALSGAPDERGFWPILVAGLALGLLLARDRTAFCEIVIDGMSRPIVMIMVMAWLMASTVGVLMSATGFVDALIWLAAQARLEGAAFIGAAFLICCAVSTATGTSFGTILVCGPLLYPAGALLGADSATLAGAILGGATFGDSISPISDTTIASALSQGADIGGTVRSRLKYVFPCAAAALTASLAFGHFKGAAASGEGAALAGDPKGLPMILAPAIILFLLLRGRHLLHGLLAGLVAGTALGLALDLLPVERALSLDPMNFTARSFVIEGVNRGIGISVFTILLLGLVAAMEAGGALDRLASFSETLSRSARSAEIWIVGAAAAAAALTTHSIVSILAVGNFAQRSGRRFGIHRYRRANLLDLTVVVVPFLLPYCIPVILASGITGGGDGAFPRVSPWRTGLHNFYSWSVLAMLIFSLASGYGRRFLSDDEAGD